jgi:hypothetical protein
MFNIMSKIPALRAMVFENYSTDGIYEKIVNQVPWIVSRLDF